MGEAVQAIAKRGDGVLRAFGLPGLLVLAAAALVLGDAALLGRFLLGRGLGCIGFLEPGNGPRHVADFIVARGIGGDACLTAVHDAVHGFDEAAQRGADAVGDEQRDGTEHGKERERGEHRLPHGGALHGLDVVNVDARSDNDAPGPVYLQEARLVGFDAGRRLRERVVDEALAGRALADSVHFADVVLTLGILRLVAALADGARLIRIEDGDAIEIAPEEVVGAVEAQVADDGERALLGLGLLHDALVDELLVRVEHADGHIDELLEGFLTRLDRVLVVQGGQRDAQNAAADREQSDQRVEARLDSELHSASPGFIQIFSNFIYAAIIDWND